MDPGWNPPRKKKNTAKTRPTAGKGCMREGYTQTVTESQHAPAVGRKRPGGEFWESLGAQLGPKWRPKSAKGRPKSSKWRQKAACAQKRGALFRSLF